MSTQEIFEMFEEGLYRPAFDVLRVLRGTTLFGLVDMALQPAALRPWRREWWCEKLCAPAR